jgi:hypothetical protein
MRAKQDIQDMIGSAQRQGKNNQVRVLSQVNRQLDGALERASPQYRTANDAFRDQSRVIDAVETGRNAASGRTRAADNIQTFQSMRPAEQNAFRAGYVDPKIASIESASISPATNKARMLMTEKSGQEFPTFGVPQGVDRMGRQIAREQRMFETTNASMGGSKTADNLADAAEASKFDPSIMENLFKGRPVSAVMTAVLRLASESRGLPPAVMTRVANTLMETRPEVARQMLQSGMARNTQNNSLRAFFNALTVNTGASVPGRLAAP